MQSPCLSLSTILSRTSVEVQAGNLAEGMKVCYYSWLIKCVVAHTGCRNMLHSDIYILLSFRAGHCIMLLGHVGGTSLRTMSLNMISSLQELHWALPHSWKGIQVLVRVSTQCWLELENFCMYLVSPQELKLFNLKFQVENSALDFCNFFLT